MPSILDWFRRKKPDKELSRIVNVTQGNIQGFQFDIDNDRKVDIFLGVPFATPPIGELRFKKPQPAEPWDGVRPCLEWGNRGVQKESFLESIGVPQSEDNLYLNVMTPQWEGPQTGFPVMVFVHGGAFLIDSAVKYGYDGLAKYMCRHDVVVVTIQYRLGLLGFFTTGDDVCPGNFALWDQTLALQWVRDNIRAFGGNPDCVTIFGQSAGGASVDLLSLSPHSRDLFHRVIPMAGNAECNWAVAPRKTILEECRKTARKLGYEGDDSAEMIAFLRTKKASEFGRGAMGWRGMEVSLISLDTAPVIDGDFLPRSIDELRQETPRKPVMIGTCEHEGLAFAIIDHYPFTIKGMEKWLSEAILEEENNDWKELREEAMRLYMEGVDEKNKDAVTRAFIDMYSDVFLGYGNAMYAEKTSQRGDEVYLYSFDYFNPDSFGLLGFKAPFKAASHCTELPYIFGHSIIFPFTYNDKDRAMIDRMTEMWTNFAKFGNPNGADSSKATWKPTDPRTLKYFSINESCEMRENYGEKRINFWRRVKMPSKTS